MYSPTRGAYFGEAAIAFERRVSPGLKVGGSFNTGWPSATFNDAYIGIDKSALNFTGMEGWLTVYVKPHFYIGPHFQFTTTVDRAVRTALARPTLFFVGLATGVEFR
jgi:outer membrane scaffolding protein for murein synthesis (MipA/OmpV family)